MLSQILKKPKKVLPFSLNDFRQTITTNRSTLRLIDNWIDETAFNNSYFNFGVPEYIMNHINKNIDQSLTYSDYLLFLCNKYFEPVNFLEIGVSVGKNFFQIINGVKKAQITGFDIEEINPVIKAKLEFIDKIEWVTAEDSIKKNKSSLNRFRIDGKNVNYMSADVLDGNSWSKLSGNKFNIIFSDALHTPDAIKFEFEQLVKNDLLAEKFIILWDDLDGEMESAFYKIVRKYKKGFRIKEMYLLKMNGWIGQHEREHNVGLISNFKF